MPPTRTVSQLQKQQLVIINQLDIKSRAKTVRIGKVRWPPAPNPAITFQYELKKYFFIILFIIFAYYLYKNL
jgi:hypothetical protein